MQLMCTQYVFKVNPGCHICYPGFVGKTYENSEAGSGMSVRRDENESALCRLYIHIYAPS